MMNRLLFLTLAFAFTFTLTATQLGMFPQAAAADEQLYSPIQTAQKRTQDQERQSIQQGPQGLTAGGGGAEKKCNEGDTNETCCEGINYCSCLGNPLGGGPLSCICSPPPGKSC